MPIAQYCCMHNNNLSFCLSLFLFNFLLHLQNQFINIVMNLLDALKTSFSHRSLAARSLGKKDSVSDFAIASIAMMKSYVRTTGNNDDRCMQKYVCEANTECNKDIGGNSIFCQLGRYADRR